MIVDKLDPPKRRAKSAGKKAGKAVSFIDEKEGETDLPPIEAPLPPQPEVELVINIVLLKINGIF